MADSLKDIAMFPAKRTSLIVLPALGCLLCCHSSWAREPQSQLIRSFDETNAPPGSIQEQAVDEQLNERFFHEGVGPSFQFDYRYPLTGPYRALFIGHVQLEIADDDYNGFAFKLGGGSLYLKPGTTAAAALHDPVILEAAFSYRRYFTPATSNLRPYGIAELGLNGLHFDYRADPYSGGDYVSHDVVAGFNAYVGVGLNAYLTHEFHLFAEMGYGGIGYLHTTEAELKNRYLDSFGYVAIKAGLGWTF